MTESPDLPDRRLDAAVSLGIITAEQAAQIRALGPERRPVASPRAPGASVIAYGIGAITVLVAMGWFLADRWDYLGAAGVLAVVTVYAALFTLVAVRMRREGFPIAEGVAALLTVALVPLAVIALSELLPWMPQQPGRVCGMDYKALVFVFDFWTCRGLEVTVELATLAAAIAAWRITRFSPFALLVGALAMRFVFHGGAVAFRGEGGVALMAWLWVLCASLMVATAYVVDRRPAQDHDVGLWLHLLAAIAAIGSTVTLLNQFEHFRQLLLPAAFVAFMFSLRMRRTVWTLLGLVWFVTYLGWLAVDVFRDTPVFPIVLAALGIGVIVATVWIQRNHERLVARVGGLESGRTPSFPGGVVVLLLPVVVALLHLPTAVELDRARAAESQAMARQMRSKQQRPIDAETPRPERP